MTETRQQKRIRQILDQAEEAKDNSLRGHALKRATGNDMPRTLTAWEWEQWYTDNGKPEAHRPAEPASADLPWWQRLFRRKPRASKSSHKNCVRSVNEDEEF